jgi:dihydrodipicolinate synthase/N-acetylneuraminate lyase
MKLGAINVAAVTPHREAAYEADLAATLELVDYLCAAGVHGIALLGSTGALL